MSDIDATGGCTTIATPSSAEIADMGAMLTRRAESVGWPYRIPVDDDFSPKTEPCLYLMSRVIDDRRRSLGNRLIELGLTDDPVRIAAMLTALLDCADEVGLIRRMRDDDSCNPITYFPVVLDHALVLASATGGLARDPQDIAFALVRSWMDIYDAGSPEDAYASFSDMGMFVEWRTALDRRRSRGLFVPMCAEDGLGMGLIGCSVKGICASVLDGLGAADPPSGAALGRLAAGDDIIVTAPHSALWLSGSWRGTGYGRGDHPLPWIRSAIFTVSESPEESLGILCAIDAILLSLSSVHGENPAHPSASAITAGLIRYSLAPDALRSLGRDIDAGVPADMISETPYMRTWRRVGSTI